MCIGEAWDNSKNSEGYKHKIQVIWGVQAGSEYFQRYGLAIRKEAYEDRKRVWWQGV